MAVTAIAISRAVDWVHREEREAEYMSIVERYDKPDVSRFPEMYVHLVNELERHADAPTDVLGAIFHELELHNKYRGQFFTPQVVCDMMGQMSLGENDPDINEKGFLSVSEPCAGSGAMILGFAKAMARRNQDWHRQMVVTATDVDLKCVYMTYLQLSLYGIPAVVIHGNTLLMQEWSRWYTPVYMLDGWLWRKTCGNADRRYPEDEAMKRASDPLYAAMRKVEELISGLSDNEKPDSENKLPVFENAIPESVNEKPRFDIQLHETATGQFTISL